MGEVFIVRRKHVNKGKFVCTPALPKRKHLSQYLHEKGLQSKQMCYFISVAWRHAKSPAAPSEVCGEPLRRERGGPAQKEHGGCSQQMCGVTPCMHGRAVVPPHRVGASAGPCAHRASWGTRGRQREGACLEKRPTNSPKRKTDAKAKLLCHYFPFESEELKR